LIKNSKKLTENLQLYLLTILFLGLLIFGKKFAYIKFLSLPGYISDLLLIVIIFLGLNRFTKFKKIDIVLFVYLTYIFFSSEETSINNKGQDLILVLYPVILFYVIKNIKNPTLPKFISSGPFLNLYSSFILIDYLNDRTLFIESFLNIEFKLNLTNLSVLKPNEAGLGILLIIFLYLKNNIKIKYFYFIIPGLTIAFLISESRSFGLGFIIFLLFYAIKDTKKFLTILFGLVLGVLISFQISYVESEKMLSLIQQNETEKIYPDEVGYKRFRKHNFYETKYRYSSLFSQYIEIKEIRIESDCPNNIDFRRSLWSAGLDDLVQNKSTIFFGKGVGFGIPNYLYSNDMLNDCFKPIIESNKPLRSLHNSFLTLLYRFGLLFLLTLILAFKNVIVKVIKTDYMSLVLCCCVIAFIDPLLDSPVASIPFWILLFIEGKENA
jgi:hypothetical protein